MRFVDCVDYGDAPLILAGGVASVFLLSPNIIQVSLFRAIPQPDGTVENRIVGQEIWDRALWIAARPSYWQAREALERGGLRVGGIVYPEMRH